MLKALLRKEFKELFAIYRTRKKKGKVISVVGLIALFSLLYFSMAISFVGIDFLFISVIPAENLWLYFGLNILITLLLASLLDVLSTYVSLYKGRDKELMLSLPIKSSMMVLSKVFVVFVFGLANASYVMLPCYVIYGLNYGFKIGEILLFLLIFLLAGLLVTGITLILSYLLSLTGNFFKSKLAKGLITMGLLMFFYYFIYFRLNRILENFESNVGNIASGLAKNFKLSTLLGHAMEGDTKSIIISLVITLCFFLVTFFLVNSNYIRIITRTVSEKKGKVNKGDVKSRSVVSAMLFKELKHFTSSLAYLLNCGLGLCIMLFAGVAALLKAKAVSDYVDSLGSHMAIPIIGIVLVVSAMNGISAPSISLEGKSLWILKSSPVKYMDVFKGKILLHYVLNIVPAIFLYVAMSIVLKPEVGVVILGIVIINVYILINAIIGLDENLRHYNLDWINEAVPVKQGVSVIFTMLVAWGGLLIIFGLGTLLSLFINTYIVLGIELILGIAILTLLYLNLMNKGVKRFANIS